jgi:hypothetical protein
MEIYEVDSNGLATLLNLKTESNLLLEGQTLKFTHSSQGTWNYAIKYSLESFTSITPVYHNFTVTTTSTCAATVFDEIELHPDQDIFNVTLPD